MQISDLIIYLTAIMANRGNLEVVAHGSLVREVCVEPLVTVSRGQPGDPLKQRNTGNHCCILR